MVSKRSLNDMDQNKDTRRKGNLKININLLVELTIGVTSTAFFVNVGEPPHPVFILIVSSVVTDISLLTRGCDKSGSRRQSCEETRCILIIAYL